MPYADPVKRKEFMRTYYRANKEKWTRNAGKWWITLKREVFQAYGNICACCGEREPQFLSLDHVHNNGASHRRQLNTNCQGVYVWAKKNGYPKDLQLLCMNCNFAKGMYGRCPHGNTQ